MSYWTTRSTISERLSLSPLQGQKSRVHAFHHTYHTTLQSSESPGENHCWIMFPYSSSARFRKRVRVIYYRPMGKTLWDESIKGPTGWWKGMVVKAETRSISRNVLCSNQVIRCWCLINVLDERQLLHNLPLYWNEYSQKVDPRKGLHSCRQAFW